MRTRSKNLLFLDPLMFALLMIAAAIIWLLFFSSLTLKYDENVNTLSLAFLLSLIYTVILVALTKWRKSMLNKFGMAMFVAGIITNPISLFLATTIAVNA